MQGDLLTTADIAALTGWHIQRVQRLCRCGKIPAKDISMGSKKPRYLIRRVDWEAFLTPDNAPPVRTTPTRSRKRIDAGVEKVFG